MTEPHEHLSEADEADLAALADGRIDAARREELEARVGADPVFAAALERQRRGLAALAAATARVTAPRELRARIEDMAGEAARSRRARRARRAAPWQGLARRPRWLPAAGFAAAAAAAALVAVVVAGGGGPAVDAMLAAATRPPIATASLDPAQGRLLRDQVEGVRFPNYEAKFGWRAGGVRTDTIEDRATRTVFYERAGRRIAYTIVAGEALPERGDADRARRDGVALRSFAKDGRTVVTWRRKGHTCVLSGVGVAVDTLLELAAWKGKGAVEF